MRLLVELNRSVRDPIGFTERLMGRIPVIVRNEGTPYGTNRTLIAVELTGPEATALEAQALARLRSSTDVLSVTPEPDAEI